MNEWRGDEVQRKVEDATRAGMLSVMSDCVIEAKQLVHVRKSILQGSLQLRRPEMQGDSMVGQWGSFDVDYAYWQEFLPEPRGKPYLRPAADRFYPELSDRIKKAFGG